MTIGTPEFVLLSLLALLLCIGAVTDWKRRSIDNWLTMTIALSAPLYWWATSLGWWPGIAFQLGIAAVVIAIGIGLFAVNAMGGGDVKLLAGLALWFPGLVMMRLAIIMSIAGGILTIAMLVRHKVTKSDTPLEVPYGLAISFAGLWTIYERYFNQFG